MKKISLFILLISFSASAQKTTRDSLIQQLNRQQPDTVRVNLLNAIALQSWGIDPQKNLEYSEEALQLSQQLRYQKGIANSYREISRYYWSQTEYTKTMEYALLAQDVYRGLGDSIGVSWSYAAISLSYSQANNYDKAIEYQKKALSLNTRINNETGIANNLNSIGYIHELQKDYTQAGSYYAQALAMRIKIGDSTEMIIPLINAGAINVTLKNYPTAKKYLFDALALAEKFHNKNMMSVIHQNLGTISDGEGNYNKALEHLKYALGIAHEIGDKKRKEGVYEVLQNLEEAHKNYPAAYRYSQQLKYIRDTLYSQEQSMKMAEMEARAERIKTKQALEILEKDNQIQTLWANILLAGLALVVITFILIYQIQRYRERKNHEFLRLQLDLLTGQNKTLTEKYKQVITGNTETPVASANQRLLRSALEIVEKNIADPEFSVERLAEEIAMSRANLHRKLKTITGFAPSDFIRNVRLNRAANLLRNNADSVAQIGLRVGFEDQSYFSKVFKKQFGIAPSEYAKPASVT